MARAMVLFLLLAVAAPAGWRDAPAYLPLFAAAGERRAAFRAYVSDEPLDEALRRIGTGWEARALLPAEAFGQTGGYDRSKLARLYGAVRPRVARGPRIVNGRTVEAWTLISPYPDPALERLEPGTLLIVLSLGPS